MDHLKKLCSELEVDPSELKEMDKGSFLLSLTNELTIAIKSVSPFIFLHATIAPCWKENREELFTLLMKANFLGQGTFGAAIGLSLEEKHVTLSHSFPEGGEYRAFHDTVEDFVNTIEYWRKEIK